MKESFLKLDYYGLVNLHKALLEAKFHLEPENKLVSGSPIIATVYIQVRDLLMESDNGNQWKEWFRLKNRSDRRNQAILLAVKDNRWLNASLHEKQKIASDYLAPFIFDKEELDDVVNEIENLF